MMYRAVNKNVDFWFKTSDCVVTEASKGLDMQAKAELHTFNPKPRDYCKEK